MLQVENLSKTYRLKDRDIEALKNISFSTKPGEVLGIVGKSGGGKSTLMKILRGMESFDSGRIIMDGITILPDSSDDVVRKQMAITAIHLQRDFALWTESALKNVVRRVYSRKMGYEVLPTPEDSDYDEMYNEAMYYLRMVGLENKAHHLATILSGGEKQRLLIARQLAKKPKILLLDEPATMACPATKQEVLDAVKNVNREMNLTIIVVSHLPEIHEYLADRLIWLESGEIVADGRPAEVLDRFMAGIAESEPLKPRPDSRPLIKVRGLCKRNYVVGTGEVLKALKMENLNFEIFEGEITSFIGNSGGGKTTLLKILQGIKMPDEGSVCYRYADKWVDMLAYSPERMDVRRTMGIMYQEFALYSGETILDQIAYQLGVKGNDVIEYARSVAEEMGISDKVLDVIYTLTDMSEEDAKAAFEALGLTRDIFNDLFPRFPATEAQKFAKPVFKLMSLDPEVMWKLPDQLSGGERVRASLAILLAARPKILILDEPFGDIDPLTLREVSNAIKKINAKYNTTIILVSHHVGFVKEVSHRAILIEKGAMVADGDPDTVCNAFLASCHAPYLRYMEEACAVQG
ncbi:MAG: putative ABC transporter ATP-binding protein [Methanosaeta sp. PtaB.Bin018]|nr:MAG: putative ABC transporter ATP-binding protein [Methanosaeta sp. PtaB.Bin018]OPY43361.1 MAG: putative ABC transporter ATP-binding protein [Methanosaeta sp. PtaU1.Bin016]